MTKTEGTYTYLQIALAGISGEAPNEYSKLSPARVTIYDKRLANYYHRLVNGGMVIDKRPAFDADNDAAFRAVVSGPMINSILPLGTIDTLSGMVKSEDPNEARALDSVSKDLYAKYWSKLGARIGVRSDDTIVWNDGEIEPITIFS
jgi:hypothetical protein